VPVTEGSWEPTIQTGACPLLDIIMVMKTNEGEKEVPGIFEKF
jgi:hypothetical protein